MSLKLNIDQSLYIRIGGLFSQEKNHGFGFFVLVQKQQHKST